MDEWTALDPVNPIYNFLIEYYGIKGAKGARRLGRWAPDPSLLLGNYYNNKHSEEEDLKIENGHFDADVYDRLYKAAMEASHGQGGILLQNANTEES